LASIRKSDNRCKNSINNPNDEVSDTTEDANSYIAGDIIIFFLIISTTLLVLMY